MGGATRAARRVILALPVVLLVERAWDRRWIYDDGFINLRVVDMVLSGHGPVFNAGERVEATTSTLWLWVLVVGDLLLPLRLEWVAVMLGIVGAAAGLGLAIGAAARLHRLVGADGFTLPAAALVLAALPPVWDYSTSGLEGGLTFAWLGAVQWLLVRWVGGGAERRLSAPSAAIVGLGPLVRPDLALVTVVVLVAVTAAQWGTDTWRHRVRLAAAALAIPLAYQVFRMGYYAALVPNTALAKAADEPRWAAGWAYAKDLFGSYGLLLPLALLVAAAVAPVVGRAWAAGPRARVAVAALPVAGLLDGLYVVRAGGDYLHGRLLLPALWALAVPFAAAPLPAVASLRRSAAAAVRVGALAGVALWAAICADRLRPSLWPRFEAGSNIVDGRRIIPGHPVTLAHWGWDDPGNRFARLPSGEVYAAVRPVDATPPEDLRTPVVLAYGVGLTSYGLGPDYTVIDLLGLADPLAGRLRLDRRGVIGHEKALPRPWMAARISTEPVDREDLPQLEMVPYLYEPPARRFDEEVAAARRALACPPLHELWAAVREPLTPGRFLRNLAAAPRLTRLRVPPAAPEAVRELCH